MLTAVGSERSTVYVFRLELLGMAIADQSEADTQLPGENIQPSSYHRRRVQV